MANYEKEIYELGQVQNALSQKITEENQQSLGNWFAIGSSYYHEYFKQVKKINKKKILWQTSLSEDKRVNSGNFKKLVSASPEIQEIIDFYRWLSNLSEEEEEPTKQKREDSTVPATLETMVASYKDSQADKLEADTTHTVADAVKRARKTWDARNRTETILKNRTEKQKEAEDDFFINTVDPKSESRQAIYRNVESVASQAVIAQAAIIQAANLGIGLSPAQIKQATDDLTYLGLTGAVDLTNFNDLNTISQLAFIVQGIKFTSPINNVNEVVQAWQKAEEIEPYSDKAEELEKQIILADQEAENILREKDEIDKLNKFERELNKNIDLDNDITAAAIEAHNVQKALLKAAPNAKHPQEATPLELHGKELEVLLRKADPTLLINGEGLGVRTAAVLQVTNSGNKNISPEALKLFSLGLDAAGLDKAVANNPALKTYFETSQGKSIYQQVHFQLSKIQNSKLGQEIAGNIKPLSGISGSLTNFYNRNPALRSATKLILDPGGTVRSWVNKRIGTRIGNELLKRTGSALSQKLGNFILKEGLQQGIKKFASEAAKKLAMEAAKKLGVTLVGDSLVATVATALGVPTAGLSLIIGAIIIVAQFVIDATIGLAKKGLDNVWRELGWGDKFRSRDLILPVAAGGAVAATAGVTFLSSLIAIRRSVQIATVSAIGIIIGALVTMGAYITIAFLIAPVLSTLVQFDSLEKVDYSDVGGSGSGPGPGGGGGVYNLDCGEDAGAEIMIQAGQYPVVKNLLTGPGRTGYCITPTKITIHWSGAWTSNDNTYDVLVTRGLSCQLGTDQDGSVQQWQQMWEKKAELAYCTGGNENNYCLNNEMVGAYFIPPGTSPSTPDEKSPSEDEIQSAVNSTCFMMKQYNLPYTQIFGHYQLRPGKIDPGVEFLEYFINRVKQECPSIYP